MRYGVVVLMLAYSMVNLSAQTPPVRPVGETRFDVVSIKPCEPRNAATPEEFLRMLAFAPLSGHLGQSTGPDCGSSGPFVTNARNRAVVILAKVVAPPDWEAPKWKGPARLEILEILKGQVASPLIEVLADRDSGVRLGVGEQWLIALQDSGIPFIQGCGVFAVKVEGGYAIGHVESNKGSWQSVPLERIRSLVRDSAQTER